MYSEASKSARNAGQRKACSACGTSAARMAFACKYCREPFPIRNYALFGAFFVVFIVLVLIVLAVT